MNKVFQVLILQTFLLLCATAASAQDINAESRDGRTFKEELPKNVQETFAKHRIAQQKKDYEEMLERGEEALKLSEQLESSFDQNQQLVEEDFQRLERLESLLKKIRKDLGGDDDDVEDEKKPDNLGNAVKSLRETTLLLYDELKKTTQYSISAVAIQSSNAVLRIVKFVRFWKN